MTTGGLDTSTGRRVAELSGARGSRAVTFANGDRQLVVGESDGTVRIWDWADGAVKNPRTLNLATSEVLVLATLGSRLFVAQGSHDLVIVDLSTGKPVRTLTTTAAPFSLVFTRDGRLLAGTYVGMIDVWNLATGMKLVGLKGPNAIVYGMDISPDGTMLAGTSRDGTTRLWDMSGQSLATVGMSRAAGGTRVRFLPDGRRLAIGYDDGTVEIRDLDYFFRHAAGQAEYQLGLLRAAGETFPRAEEVLAWARATIAAQ
jgi:WD40 repeat protein